VQPEPKEGIVNKETIAKVQSYGLDVYMRNETDSWLIFTDGKRIGYLQEERSSGFTYSTVHKANRTTGTGFQVGRHEAVITKSALESCFVFAPHWVGGGDAKSVEKYRNIAEYISADDFNSAYRKVSDQPKPGEGQ
jgi:hypothetical protein